MRGSSLIIAAEWARSSRAFILRVIFFPCLRWIDVIITIIEVSVGVVGVLWISIFCVETVSILLHALINLTHLFYGHLPGIVIFLLCNQFFRFLHIQFFLFLVRYHLLLCFEASQEAVVSLISGGFDSAVASYLTMKRGAKTHFLFFNLGGAAHEIGVKQVSYYLWKKFGSAARVKFISVPFEEVVGELLQNINHSYRGVVLKRMMLRVAQRVADKIKAEAPITSESIGQVSSQTLTNLGVIDQVTDTLRL